MEGEREREREREREGERERCVCEREWVTELVIGLMKEENFSSSSPSSTTSRRPRAV